ncbi:hypothetical protein DdX_12300 [Ditylenchus destructor]|uniref:Uncharacterized protein n=1 Tax=Ditylenchus destructor TaxID=166010 RepID=A0AAD4MZ75_9BILA|nr:hypothetical protein DdX_12300 [Ditylenchus destructor]
MVFFGRAACIFVALTVVCISIEVHCGENRVEKEISELEAGINGLKKRFGFIKLNPDAIVSHKNPKTGEDQKLTRAQAIQQLEAQLQAAKKQLEDNKKLVELLYQPVEAALDAEVAAYYNVAMATLALNNAMTAKTGVEVATIHLDNLKKKLEICKSATTAATEKFTSQVE